MPTVNPKYLIVAVVFGGAMLLTQMTPSVSASSDSVLDANGLLAAYHAIQFSSARELQRRLISEGTRHSTAVNRLRRTYRTSMTALRRRILELGVDVTVAAVQRVSLSYGMPTLETNGPAFAGQIEGTATEVVGASAGVLKVGSGSGNRTLSMPTQESSMGTAITSDGAARTLLQDASPVEPSCSTDELMAVQADPMGAVVGLFTTNPSCAMCLVPCGSASDAVSCAMGCLKQARIPTQLFDAVALCTPVVVFERAFARMVIHAMM
jgi:hypothetical protein